MARGPLFLGGECLEILRPIATHSPFILGFGEGIIYEFTEAGITKTEYHNTEQYRMNLASLTGRELFALELWLKPIKKSLF